MLQLLFCVLTSERQLARISDQRDLHVFSCGIWRGIYLHSEQRQEQFIFHLCGLQVSPSGGAVSGSPLKDVKNNPKRPGAQVRL
jgi:hypothetical protein